MTADHELKIYHLPRSFTKLIITGNSEKKCLLLVKHYFDVSSHEAFLSKLLFWLIPSLISFEQF